jgi:hypothetical protein
VELWYNYYIQTGENGISYFRKNESWRCKHDTVFGVQEFL